MAKRRRRRRRKSKAYLVAIVFILILMIAGISAVWVVFQKLDANEKKARADRQEALRQQELETKEEKEENAKKVLKDMDKEEQQDVVITSMTLVAAPADAASLPKLTIANSSASSELQQSDGTINSASFAFDGNDQTSWQDGVDGDGVGESIIAQLDGSNTIKYISFKLGNWSSKDYFNMNNRPKTLEIVAGSATGTIAFKDEMQEMWVQLPNNTTADSISFAVKDVYSGDEWEDTCISEINIYGEAATSEDGN